MVEVYNQVFFRGDFEIVFVAIEGKNHCGNEDVFANNFSMMPWLAVPYSDSTTRMRFATFKYSACIIINKQGIVLKLRSCCLFHYFGAEWYPFTLERAKEISSE